jgi:DNA ligase (NAD+)
MDIEGFSISTIEKFTARGFIENYADIFALERYGQDIMEMDGFGHKSYANLIEAIERAKDADLPNFIYALGINHVGLSNAKLLCRHYGYDLARIIAATPDELVEIEGFGEVISESVHKYFSNDKNIALLNKALGYIRLKTPEQVAEVAAGLPLAGKTIVITGDLEHYANRKELQKEIEALGGKVTGSVTSKTSYLINNDAESESSKNKKARELGVPVVTEKEFIKMIS